MGPSLGSHPPIQPQEVGFPNRTKREREREWGSGSLGNGPGCNHVCPKGPSFFLVFPFPLPERMTWTIDIPSHPLFFHMGEVVWSHHGSIPSDPIPCPIGIQNREKEQSKCKPDQEPRLANRWTICQKDVQAHASRSERHHPPLLQR